MKKQNIVFYIFGTVIICGLAFFGGMKYQESKTPNFMRQFGSSFQGSGNFQGLQGRMGTTGMTNQTRRNLSGFRPVSGDIIASDSKSITVKLQDGSSKIVVLSDKTVINKASQATAGDLKLGETVAVFGSENSDGSVTAQNIQLNPMSNLREKLDGSNNPPPQQ